MSLSPVRDGLSTVPAATQQLTGLSNGSGAFDPAQRAYTSATEDLQNVLEPQERLPAVRPNRNFRHFKNPPQPHMCIKDSTRSGEELYINVMSWTRIVMPVSAEEPIPLYGGMKVPAGIRGSTAQVYAVMANPEILKHVGRNCEDVEEKHALVELMSDFVEAMNPGLTLTRRAEILKDRDLSGELKDIWSAVQAKRERDKDGFPQSFGVQPAQSPSRTLIVEFGPASAPKPTLQQNGSIASTEKELQPSLSVDKSVDISLNEKSFLDTTNRTSKEAASPDKEKSVKTTNGDVITKMSSAIDVSSTPSNVRNVAGSISNGVKPESTISPYVIEPVRQAKGIIIENYETTTQTEGVPRALNEVSEVPLSPTSAPQGPAPATPTPPTSTPPTSTKKEKIGGFLPNGCHNIFPFIKSKSSNSKKDKKQKGSNVVDVSVGGSAVTQLPANTKVPAVEPIKTAASGLNNGTALFDHHSPLMMTTASSTKLELANINPDYIDMVKNMQMPADACVDKMKKLKL